MSDTLTTEELAQLRQMESDDAATAEMEPQSELVAEPAPAAVEETPPPAPAEKPERPMVDKRALDEAREEQRRLRQELNESRQKAAADQARVEERLRLLVEAGQRHMEQTAPAAKEEEPVPDFNTDPAGFIKHGFTNLQRNLEAVAERQRRLEEGTSQLTAAQQERRQMDELADWGRAQEEAFARETPDYREAMQHLKAVREAQVRTLGLTDPTEIRQAIGRDLFNTAKLVRERGGQFGKTLYELAQHSGYRREEAASERAPANGNGGGATPAADTAAERLLRGQDMATTIGATGGAPRGEPAAQHLVNMSDAEFERLLEKTVKDGGHAALRNIFGA